MTKCKRVVQKCKRVVHEATTFWLIHSSIFIG